MVDLPFRARARVPDEDSSRATGHPRRRDAGLKDADTQKYGGKRAAFGNGDERLSRAGRRERTVDGARGQRALAVGERDKAVPAHVDPTVNLHAALNAVRRRSQSNVASRGG